MNVLRKKFNTKVLWLLFCLQIGYVVYNFITLTGSKMNGANKYI